MHPLKQATLILGSQAALAARIGVVQSAVANWMRRGSVPSSHCRAIEVATSGRVTRRDLRPNDWQKYWPDLEEVDRLRTQVAQLMERLRKYEPVPAPALPPQAPAAINSEARQQAQEVAHG